MDHLPTEVLEMIAIYLGTKDLKQTGLTCHNWHVIIKKSLTHTHIKLIFFLETMVKQNVCM